MLPMQCITHLLEDVSIRRVLEEPGELFVRTSLLEKATATLQNRMNGDTTRERGGRLLARSREKHIGGVRLLHHYFNATNEQKMPPIVHTQHHRCAFLLPFSPPHLDMVQRPSHGRAPLPHSDVDEPILHLGTR